jgi:hypothetical protein
MHRSVLLLLFLCVKVDNEQTEKKNKLYTEMRKKETHRQAFDGKT